MIETDNPKIILGRPFMATAGCHVYLRRGRITFEVEECYATFCHMEETTVSPYSSLLDAFPPCPKIDIEDVLNCQDLNFDWISIEDPNQGYVKVEFATPIPPNIPKVKGHASDESAMSDYCKQAVLSLPPMEGFDAEFDLGIE